MPLPDSLPSLSDAWAVLALYLIPIGGGIPAGVLLAKSRGLQWPFMMALYLLSDIILAFAFEPLTWLFMAAAKRYTFFQRFNQALKQSMDKTIERLGVNPNPFTLIMVAFGVDPMTGRAAALAAGHGFVSGWAIAITGDMIFFTVIMISTVWLNNVLGDGTWAALIIIVLMTLIPHVLRRIRNKPA
jgi:uncharacterized membrane protein